MVRSTQFKGKNSRFRSMRNHEQLFCLLLAGLLHWYGESCHTWYYISPTCDSSYGVSLSTYSMSRSVMDCVRECSEDAMCQSVIYNHRNKTCRTNSEILETLSLACSDTVLYASLTKKSCYPPGNIFGACNDNTDCAETSDAECRHGKCLCIAGLSHKSSTKSCLPECAVYGTTFQEDQGYLLMGYNNKPLYYSNPTECMNSCVAETTFVCRTAEFYTVENTCYLSVETAATQYQAYTADPWYVVYQRDCAP